MTKIAIVTGASGGLGQAFIQELVKESLDEIWVIGRSEKQLHLLKDSFGKRIVPICTDLTKTSHLLSLSDLLKNQNPSIQWLINNAGVARMAPSQEFSFSEIAQTIDLNCKAPAALINFCIPFMEREAKILNTKEINGKKVRFPEIVAPGKVVKKALKDAKKGKDMSICSLYVKCQHLNVKLLPQRLTMKIWLQGIKKYL